jgi:hypothetical protein
MSQCQPTKTPREEQRLLRSKSSSVAVLNGEQFDTPRAAQGGGRNMLWTTSSASRYLAHMVGYEQRSDRSIKWVKSARAHLGLRRDGVTSNSNGTPVVDFTTKPPARCKCSVAAHPNPYSYALIDAARSETATGQEQKPSTETKTQIGGRIRNPNMSAFRSALV